MISEDGAAAEGSGSSPTRNDRCSKAEKTQTLQVERTSLGRFRDGHNGAIHKAGRRIGDNLI